MQSVSGSSEVHIKLRCAIDDDGVVSFRDELGGPVDDRLIRRAKREHKGAIENLISEKCEEINERIESLGRIHHDTPDPRTPPRYVVVPFDEPEPVLPMPIEPSFLGSLFKFQRARVDHENARAKHAHLERMENWSTRKRDHDRQQEQRHSFIENDIRTDIGAMEQFLEERLCAIEWPRETQVSFDILNNGTRIAIDVDLPELEDMPSKYASVPARGLKLSVKELSPTKVRRLYMEHVHGVIFRIVGEGFSALPTLNEVVISGFTQRVDVGTGHMRDEYVLSARIYRSGWERLDFRRLASLDVVESLQRHEIVRELSRTGGLACIEPLAP